MVGGPAVRLHADRVEERLAADAAAEPVQAFRERGRQPVHALGDPLQPLRPVVHRVHAGHHGQQHLGRADVARRLVAADVLFARLQGEAEGGLPGGVLRHADDAARRLALVLVLRGEERGMRPPEAERHAEALARSDRDVRPEFSGRAQQGQREQVGGDHRQCAGCMGPRDHVRVVANGAVRRRVLEQDAEEVPALEVDRLRCADVQGDPEGLGARLHHRDGLGVAVLRDEKSLFLSAFNAPAHHHRFGRRRSFIQQRRVGKRQAGQIGNHGLVDQQRLQPPLCDLRLIGRVLRVPAGVLQDIPLNDGRGDAVGVAHADERAEDLVPVVQDAQLGKGIVLAHARIERHGLAHPDLFRDGRVGQSVERLQAEGRQHLLEIGVRRAQVPVDELIGRRKGLHHKWTITIFIFAE